MPGNRRAQYLNPGNVKLFRIGENAENLELDKEHELSKVDINIDTCNILGCGHFGIVYKGMVKGEEAAFKKSRKNNGITGGLIEMKIFSHLGHHPNIVQFLGTYVDETMGGTFYIATKLCSNGSLKTYLRKLRVSNSFLPETKALESLLTLLNKFCVQIASGMQHIVEKQIVHRDLATRNVLLDRNLVCKISDFGLSSQLNELQENTIERESTLLPWRWMAYESFTELKFNSSSDMWSYGVTLWEIFTLGKMPYYGVNWTPDFANELKNGLRLSVPIFATPTTYEKMTQCWSLNDKKRPNFSYMTSYFSDLCERNSI